jgi:hypothetical protein
MANTAPISNVIDTRAGAGVAGEITRRLESTVESILLDQATDTPTAFGTAVKLASGLARKIVDGDDGTDVFGLLVRTEPSISETNGNVKEDAVHGLMRRGYANVVCAIGTPVRGLPVYVRTAADTGKAIGDLEATEASGENVAIPGWTWAVAGKDADNISEVRIA